MCRWIPILLLLLAAGPLRADDVLIRKGEYLVRAAGCVSCHTDHENDGPFLAGGRALVTPFGTFYSPNITSHPQHGIGRWSDDDFLRALRDGVAPDGSHYYPVFPYTSYTQLKDDDIRLMAAYLRTVRPAVTDVREHELPWYLFRRMMAVWKWLFFEPTEFAEMPTGSAEHNRGAYLVVIGHCSECHTPRNRFGALDVTRYLVGARSGIGDELVPNITPDRSAGIGKWSKDDLTYFLATGALPDGDYVGSSMAEVIDDSTSHLNSADLQAMAVYLKSLPAM